MPSEAAREASGLAGKPPKKRRVDSDDGLENDETIEAVLSEYWPETPSDRICCTKSKWVASGQFVAKCVESKQRERLEREVGIRRKQFMELRAKRQVVEDECAELEKEYAARCAELEALDV